MFGISGVSIYIIYVPIGSMYLLFTYMRWKMATFKGTWLGKYSLHGSYNYLYIYHIIFSTTEAYTFSRPKSALVKNKTPQTPPPPRRNSRCREAIVFLGEGGGVGEKPAGSNGIIHHQVVGHPLFPTKIWPCAFDKCLLDQTCPPFRVVGKICSTGGIW